ncbi:MAG: hypothetical protein ABSB15_07855 [Bryobacteraceae bacterium]|jgi:hypothetical protein
MRLHKSAIIAASALLLTGMILSADSVSVTLTGAGPANDGTYYMLPYQLSVGGTDYNADCYDAFDEIQLNQTWQANELTLNDAATSGRFSGDKDALNGYEEVAWLSAQPTPTEASQVELQHAIWSVFDPQQYTIDASLQALFTTAQTDDFSGFDFNDYVFLEAIQGTGSLAQSFVIFMPSQGGGGQNPSETPEPGGTVPVLIGLGLIAISRMHGMSGVI